MAKSTKRRRKRRGSVTYQTKVALQGIFTPGVSRDELKAQGLAGQRIVSHRTMRDYLDMCCKFTGQCKQVYGIRLLEEIEPEMAEDFIQRMIDRDLSGGYIGKTKAAIRKLDVAIRIAGWKSKDAPELLEAGGGWHSDRRPERAYTRQRAEQVVCHMREHAKDKQTADVAWLQRVTGLRVSEAAMIRGKDIDLETCTIHTVRATKGGRPRTVNVDSEHQEFLRGLREQAERHRDGHVFQGRGDRGRSLAGRVRAAVRYACDRLGIECYSTHGFRRCWAQEQHRELCDEGLDDRDARREVAKGLGHNRYTVTYAYIPRGG